MDVDHRKDIYNLKKNKFKPGLFLDRDGVIIEDCHFINNPEKVRLCKGISKVINKANALEWPVVVVTNQSGIYRGFISWDDYLAVNERMLKLLGSEAIISAIYANSCGPNSSIKSWRKPSPLMILDAAKTLNIDLERSIMIGDRITDLFSAKSARLKKLCHVQSGHGKKELPLIQKEFDISNNVNQNIFIQNSREFIITLIKDLTYFPYELFTL